MAHQDPVRDAEARAHYVSGFGYIPQTGRLTDGPADSDLDPPPPGLARSYSAHDTIPGMSIRQYMRMIEERSHLENDRGSLVPSDGFPFAVPRGHPRETQRGRPLPNLPQRISGLPQILDPPGSLYIPGIGLTNNAGSRAINGDNEELRQIAVNEARSRLRWQQVSSQSEPRTPVAWYPSEAEIASAQASTEASQPRGSLRSLNIPGVTHDFLDGRPLSIGPANEAEPTATEERLLDLIGQSNVHLGRNAPGADSPSRPTEPSIIEAAIREVSRRFPNDPRVRRR